MPRGAGRWDEVPTAHQGGSLGSRPGGGGLVELRGRRLGGPCWGDPRAQVGGHVEKEGAV